MDLLSLPSENDRNSTYWISDIDIQNCFGEIGHSELRKFLDLRVKDGVIRRLIDKWLKAEILEEGRTMRPTTGTMQGGVLSPVLANVFLHHVIDEWFDKDVKPRLKGHGFLIRYADDCVFGFRYEDDARRVFSTLSKRLARFGLRMHPEKSQIVDFRPPPYRATTEQRKRYGREVRKIQTFDSLGFTHHWVRSRKGNWVVSRRTMKSRFNRGLKSISNWCKHNRHKPIEDQAKRLSVVLKGHYNYYGLTGNFRSIHQFCYRTARIWKKWLSRRSRNGWVTWEQLSAIVQPLPPPPAQDQKPILSTFSKPII